MLDVMYLRCCCEGIRFGVVDGMNDYECGDDDDDDDDDDGDGDSDGDGDGDGDGTNNTKRFMIPFYHLNV